MSDEIIIPEVSLNNNDVRGITDNELPVARETAINNYMFTVNEYLRNILDPEGNATFKPLREQMEKSGGMPDWAKSYLDMLTGPTSVFSEGMGSIRGESFDTSGTKHEFDIRVSEGSLDPSKDAPGEIHYHVFQDRIQLTSDVHDRYPNPDERIDLHLRAPSSDTPEELRKLELTLIKGKEEYVFNYPPQETNS